MRLDKYVSTAAAQSRSDAKGTILHGQVSVNGVICKKSDTQVDENDEIALLGNVLSHSEYVYIMVDKPIGVVSVSMDKRDKTVVDLVQSDYPRRKLFPAGRLDKSSTGFVLLTDDGNFAHDILSPRHHVSKTYEVLLDTPLTQSMIDGFANGVTLADGTKLGGATVEAISIDSLLVRVVLAQGVYHQIKRMFGVYDAGVNELRRIAIGKLALDSTLGLGGYRAITKEELSKITQRESN
ncbi:MAG: pseudouridine synthase [Oscillospiraceae bacterium]